MAVNVFKNAIFLANQPFRVVSYLRAVTDNLVSRFGSAEQGQTNLDLLKSETQKSFRGGMFQRVFDDPEKVSTISNAYYNKIDDKLYPTPDWEAISSSTNMDPDGVSSWCYLNNNLYVTWRYYQTPQFYNILLKFDADMNVTPVTLPTALVNCHQLELCVYENTIFIGGKERVGVTVTGYRYDGVTTFTAHTGGTDVISYCVFNDKLYCITYQRILFLVGSPLSGTATFTKIDVIGHTGVANYRNFKGWVEFNNTLYIGMDDGLYRFDGTAVTAALDYSKSPDFNNFKYLAVFNGRLYYVIKNKLFQFDGINIEELQDFGAAYHIDYMIGGVDRLWIATRFNTGVPYSDKFVSGVPTYAHSVFCYDGVGFFEYKVFDNSDLDFEVTEARMVLMPVNNAVYAFSPDLYLNGSGDPATLGYRRRKLDLADEFTLTNPGAGFTVVSSEIDNDYPSVTKVINGLLINHSTVQGTAFPVDEAEFKVEIQQLLNGEWTDWDEVWNSSQPYPAELKNNYLLHEQSGGIFDTYYSTQPAVYHRLRFRITLNWFDPSTIIPALSDFSVRYTIQPSFKLKWQLTLDLAGFDTQGWTTPTGGDGVLEDRKATTLRKMIYDTYRDKMPILLYDMDFTTVKEVGEVVDPEGDEPVIVLHGTDFLLDGDTMAIQDPDNLAGAWINRRVDDSLHDDVNDETTLNYNTYHYEFGHRGLIGGSTSAGLSDAVPGAQVRKSHAVYIKNILNERYIVDDNTINDDRGQGHYSDIPSQITLEIVEI